MNNQANNKDEADKKREAEDQRIKYALDALPCLVIPAFKFRVASQMAYLESWGVVSTIEGIAQDLRQSLKRVQKAMYWLKANNLVQEYILEWDSDDTEELCWKLRPVSDWPVILLKRAPMGKFPLGTKAEREQPDPLPRVSAKG